MSDDAALQTTIKDVDQPYESDAVYTSGQMLETYLQNCHFSPFFGRSRAFQACTARSATRCSIMQIGT